MKRKKESNAYDELPATIGTEFMTMNDDCILEILKHLNGDDLCNVANVCVHLRLLAQMVYASKKDGEKELTLVHDNNKWKALRKHLRTFGAYHKSLRLVSTERNHRCHCRDTGLECITYLTLNAENLEHLEIDMLSHVLTDTFFHEIPNFHNLKTLKVYSIYNCGLVFGIEIIKKLPQLSELVWGYPAIFSINDLQRLTQIGENLQQLIVICHSGIYAVDDKSLNAELYQKMLDAILSRPNQKPLHVIIMGCESFMRRFQIDFPTHESFKITCVKKKSVASALNVEVLSLNSDIKISAEILDQLRDSGLIPH